MPKPVVKWIGGKTSILPQLGEAMPPKYPRVYFEPFLGGGAVLFDLDPDIHFVSDSNPYLVDMYHGVKDATQSTIELLRTFPAQHSEEFYYDCRDMLRHYWDSLIPAEKAAVFIYLNKTCFNGLWRTNQKGEFNASWGKRKAFTVNEEDIRAAAKVLRKGSLICMDAVEALEWGSPKQGGLVYCDPPYDGTFDRYTKDGFTDEDQERLALKCHEMAMDGVSVMVSNSDTPKTRAWYDGFRVWEIDAPRKVNQDGNGRGKVRELLFTANCS